MKKIIACILLLFISISTFSQKQTTPYFEFTYACKGVNTKYNSTVKSWSYEYENADDAVFVAIDVKINPKGEDYPKELIDGLVTNLGYIKTTVGSFQNLYAAVSVGESQDYYLTKATFNSNHRIYIVSVISSNKRSSQTIFNLIEKSFIIK